MNDKPPRITTSCISRCDPECTLWGSSFSSREQALEFQRKVEEKLDSYGVSGAFLITMDSGDLNDEQKAVYEYRLAKLYYYEDNKGKVKELLRSARSHTANKASQKKIDEILNGNRSLL